jgi:hypothetical protein
MSKRTRSKANIPIHRDPLSCFLSPVFRLLPSAHNSYPAQLTKESWPVLRKTNPISKTPKPMQPLLPQRITEENPPLPDSKKQTQTNPIPALRQKTFARTAVGH